MKKHVNALPQTKERKEKYIERVKEEKRAIISNQNTMKLTNNYFLSPKLYKRNKMEATNYNSETVKKDYNK